MLSGSFLLLGVAMLPFVVSMPFSGPYYTNSGPAYQNTWQVLPVYSTRFQHRPLSPVYLKWYPTVQKLDGAYYQPSIYAEIEDIPEIDIRNREISVPVEEGFVRESERAENHRQKRSPFFFGGRPSTSYATSSSRGTNFSGFGTSLSNTQGSSSASSTGGGLAFGSSNSKAFGGSLGFGSPAFSSSNSNTNAAATSQSFNPWSIFQG